MILGRVGAIIDRSLFMDDDRLGKKDVALLSPERLYPTDGLISTTKSLMVKVNYIRGFKSTYIQERCYEAKQTGICAEGLE